MRTLIVDNHDSYTYNLFQLIAGVTGDEPDVVRNDEPLPDLGRYDCAIISPGPGHPGRDADFGTSARLLARRDLPVLGVCLGHQGIALAAGATVTRAPQPRHGHLTRVRHTGTGLFAGLPQDFVAVRYHSLAVPEPLPPRLIATAWAEDGVVMGLRHATRPWWGVQFHPESIASAHGEEIIQNFLRLNDLLRPRRRAVPPAAAATPPPDRQTLATVRVEHLPDPEELFARLCGDSVPAFWLDSSLVADGLSRFSFLGTSRETLSYRAGSGTVRITTTLTPPPTAETATTAPVTAPTAAEAVDTAPSGEAAPQHQATPQREAAPLGEAAPQREALPEREAAPLGDPAASHGGAAPQGVGGVADGAEVRTVAGSIFEVLRAGLAARQITGATGLPFDFAGGYVGYFGYELKNDGTPGAHAPDTPDASWIFVDRFVVLDHVERCAWAVALRSTGADADAWVAETASLISAIPVAVKRDAGPRPLLDPAPLMGKERDRYVADVVAAQERLRAGESYEICLTDRLTVTDPDATDLELYRRLRRNNPAPYAALLRLGEVSVLSSSPERFLRVLPDGTAESKPIKGTAPRSADPVRDEELRMSLAGDAKTRAENLMIVDLVRNDLGQVCEVGSVRVPAFMATESYATVHQLVSTIRGRLRAGVTAVDAVRACFPGGSMTGAPKERTMRIIDELEDGPRGVYSGALGFLSLTGTADLSIVIRTAVRHGGTLTIGAGGAIVLDSDPAGEYAEMLLKAATPLTALSPGSSPGTH
ncbi:MULTISPECIES: aminodeoxychorismate synthase component I [Catenuloplanes]|uniref:aminodeoxychorismate synthase n=1 Tax=Catenuloplanes niger TaxID=587534 RepID=A0AAE4CUB4_9ACTN|nr:aminodeoxychorismate synthase component I [Catenuloplanes niger]MDR7323218.1 para-aminobenzoate synthetase [Catenuloplanes niger]